MSKASKHLLLILPISFLISLLSFSLLYFSPGDKALMLLREKTGNTKITAEQAAEFAEHKGLDRTFFEMYGDWIGGVIKGDLGTSYVNGKSINEKVFNAFYKTFAMSFIAMLAYLVFGVTIGMYVAVHKNGLANKIANGWAVLSTAVPVFWIAMFFIWLFSVKLGVLQTVGSRSILNLVPPGLLMGTIYTGNMIVVVKEKTTLILEEPFVLHARAMGLKMGTIIKSHVLKNILGPVIALSALAFANFLGASVLIERIFSITGIGTLLNKAIGIKNYMVVAASVLIIGTIICAANMLSEAVYVLIDKREGGYKR